LQDFLTDRLESKNKSNRTTQLISLVLWSSNENSIVWDVSVDNFKW